MKFLVSLILPNEAIMHNFLAWCFHGKEQQEFGDFEFSPTATITGTPKEQLSKITTYWWKTSIARWEIRQKPQCPHWINYQGQKGFQRLIYKVGIGKLQSAQKIERRKNGLRSDNATWIVHCTCNLRVTDERCVRPTALFFLPACSHQHYRTPW